MEEVDIRLGIQRTSKSLSGSNDVPGRGTSYVQRQRTVNGHCLSREERSSRWWGMGLERCWAQLRGALSRER